MKRHQRITRWLMVVCSAAVLPAFFLKCDKAALNAQRGFFHGLGEAIAAQVVEGGFGFLGPQE
jgi:hypothetical protein